VAKGRGGGAKGGKVKGVCGGIYIIYIYIYIYIYIIFLSLLCNTRLPVAYADTVVVVFMLESDVILTRIYLVLKNR